MQRLKLRGSACSASITTVKTRFPPGWESEGIMKLHLSDDGNVINGIATAKFGNWSGKIELKRVQLVSPSVD